MTKFDSLLADLQEANVVAQNGAPQQNTNMPQNKNATLFQQGAGATTPSTTPATGTTPSTTPTASTAAKQPDYNKLVNDFNNPSVTIKTPKDLEKYGFTVSVK